MFLLPPSLDEWLEADHPARFVADFVAAQDLESLGFRMSPGEEGRPHYAPELLLSVWLFGWMDRIRSVRGLEKACHRDLAYRWLTGNVQPDHNTLWRFFRDNKKALRALFRQVVRVAAAAGLVGFALHALDGTKLQAASSTEKALHKTSLDEELKRLEAWVDAHMREVEASQAQVEPGWAMPHSMKNAEERRARVEEALALLAEADTSHLSEKEPEARAMKTRAGIVLAYNAQAVVDHDSDLVVAADVVADATDHAQLVPMVEAVAETTGRLAEHTAADAGYASGEQFEQAERRHLPVLVSTQVESSGKGDYAKSKFQYDAERDLYVCPRGEELPFQVLQRASGGKPDRRVYRCSNSTCPVRGACTTDKKGRTIKRHLTEDAFVRQQKRQDSPALHILLGLRKEIIEHLFGLVKANDGFRRFTAWGLAGVRAQWALMCTSINLRKLWPAWRSGLLPLGPRSAMRAAA